MVTPLPKWLASMDRETRAQVVRLLRLAAKVLREEETVRGR